MLIDAHAHLDLYDEESLERALEETRHIPVFTISNSVDLPSYQRNLEIADKCAWVLPTFGVHPWNAPEYAHRLEDLRPWIERSPMLGEIGLDFHWVEDTASCPAQRRVFEFFLAAAQKQAKIVNLHTKGAEAEILELLDRYDIQRAIVHWYSGPLDIFREMRDRGMFFTIGVEVGILTTFGPWPANCPSPNCLPKPITRPAWNGSQVRGACHTTWKGSSSRWPG